MFYLSLFLCPLFLCVLSNSPQQVHLSYNGDSSQMVVTWINMHNFDNPSTVPFVTYGISATSLNMKIEGTSTEWVDGGPNQVKRVTQRATMKGLVEGQKYYYSVGSVEEMSKMFYFTAIDTKKEEFRAVVFGDFSHKGGQSLEGLIEYAQNGKIDMAFHIGDISYDLDKDDGNHGDTFMKMVEPIAAYVPYMVLAGNHDVNQDYLHYKQRFTMPSNGIYTDNQFWSFDIGNYHFIGLSSEYYGSNMQKEANVQYQWFLKDMEKNKDKPWTVYFIHRPMYCSDQKKKHCQAYEFMMTRNGDPSNNLPGLEIPLNNGGVDVGFWAHRHTYERFYPLFQNISFIQSNSQNYHNSPTPVYVLNGAAGCDNHEQSSTIIPAPYSAFITGDYGFSYLRIRNNTALSIDFVPADDYSNPIDNFWLTKDSGYKPGRRK